MVIRCPSSSGTCCSTPGIPARTYRSAICRCRSSCSVLRRSTLGLLDRELRLDGAGGHLQPFLLDGVARIELLLGRLRLLELERRDEALGEELPVGVRLQAGRLELRLGGGERGRAG